MTDVDVAILHPEPGPDAGPLTHVTAAARLEVAEAHRHGFLEAGATRAEIIAGPPDGRPFGARLRDIASGLGDGGLVVLGSGAVPLATGADRRELVDAARGREARALTNNRYSADVDRGIEGALGAGRCPRPAERQRAAALAG